MSSVVPCVAQRPQLVAPTPSCDFQALVGPLEALERKGTVATAMGIGAGPRGASPTTTPLLCLIVSPASNIHYQKPLDFN